MIDDRFAERCRCFAAGHRTASSSQHASDPGGPVMFQGDPSQASASGCLLPDPLHSQGLSRKQWNGGAGGEDQAEGERHNQAFSWLIRLAAFLWNRFVVREATLRSSLCTGSASEENFFLWGAMPFPLSFATLEDLQWLRGIYIGQNERNRASILLTSSGAVEARSRRLRAEDQ